MNDKFNLPMMIHSGIYKKLSEEKVPEGGKNLILNEQEHIPLKDVYLIKNNSNSLLPVRVYGEPTLDTINFHSSYIKEEDIETDCEDNADSNDQSPVVSRKNGIESTERNEYDNFQIGDNESNPIVTISQTENIEIKNELKDPSYDKHDSEIQGSLLGKEKLNQVKTEPDYNHPFSSFHQNPISNQGQNNICMTDEQAYKLTDQLILAATGIDCAVHKISSHEVSTNLNRGNESKQVNIPGKSEPKCNQDNSFDIIDLSGLNNCHSEEIQPRYLSKSGPHVSNFTFNVLGTEVESDDEKGEEFSSNCARFLHLNVDYNKQDITECLKYLTSKFHTSIPHEFLQFDKIQECSSSDHYKISTDQVQNNISLVQKTSSEIYSNRDIAPLQEIHTNPGYLKLASPHTFTNEFLQDILQTASLSEPPTVNFDTSQSNIELDATQSTSTFALKQSNNQNSNEYINCNNILKTNNVNTSHPTLSNSQIPNFHQDRDLMSNLSPSKAVNNINNSLISGTNTEELPNSELPRKKAKIMDKNYIPSQYSYSTFKTVTGAEYNAISYTSPFEVINSKPSTSVLNLKHNVGDPRKLTAEGYSQRNATLPRDPRLWKALMSNASTVAHQNASTHSSLSSSTTQAQSIGTSSSIRSTDTVKTKESVLTNTRKHVKQPPQHQPVLSEKTSSQQSFSGKLGNSSMAKTDDGVLKKAVLTKDLFICIIGWKTRWLNIQKNTNRCPKLFRECVKVNSNYESCTEYRNTYKSLHLLNIWLTMFEAWVKNPPYYKAKLVDYSEKNFHYKNIFEAVMPLEDIPIHQGVIQIMYDNPNCKVQSHFGYVYEVLSRDTSFAERSRSDSCKEVRFSFYTVEKLAVKRFGTIDFCKLCKVRVAVNQYDALDAIESHPMQGVILNPKNYAQEIQLISFPHTYSPSVMQKNIDKIIDCVMSPENKFTLAVRESTVDPMWTLLTLVRTLVRRSTILICLTDIDRFFEVSKVLITNFENPEIVLGIKESEVKPPIHLQEYTLRSHAAKLMALKLITLERAESEVLNSNRIIVTVLSSIFLSDGRTGSLAQDLTCIIDDAHLSTEADTALPLSFKPRNVILMGERNGHLEMNSILKKCCYHKSLFHRLLEGKTGYW